MKKNEYIIPSIRVKDISLPYSLLIDSGGGSGQVNGDGTVVDPTEPLEGDDAWGGAAAKRATLWDDEDDSNYGY